MNRLSVIWTLGLCSFILGCRSAETGARSHGVGTLRIDLFHSGSAATESYGVDELIIEGPWPGLVSAVGQTDLGPYYFEIRDAFSDSLLYSDGFASIFDEWRSTGQAKDTTMTFEESVRIPLPDDLVTIRVFRRLPSGEADLVWHAEVDPSRARPSVPNPTHHVWSLLENGPPEKKIDLLLLGDGYTADEMGKWHKDAARLTDSLFSYEPFAGRRFDFNVRAVDSPSEASGIAKPSAGITHATALGATYDAFGMDRYVLTFSNKKWRDVAAAAPYEFVVIVVNDDQYGGAGIFNLYSTVSVDNDYTTYVLVHEFGHHFAGLGDEYYNSFVTYEVDSLLPEPWAPNVTSRPHEPKWKDLILPSTPLPTRWPKQEFEALQTDFQRRRRELRASNAPESEISALFTEERERSHALLAETESAGIVGAFEGALYVSQGYFRPEIDCIMFTRDKRSFCSVCSRAIQHAIDVRTGKSK